MKKIMIILCWALITAVTIPCLTVQAGDAPVDSAMAVISEAAAEVLDILKNPDLEGEDQLPLKKEKLWQVVDRVFDFDRLSRYALGARWQQMSSEEQARFSHLYSLLLGRTYMDRILAYGNEKIEVEKEVALSDTVSEVRTTIYTGDTGVPVFYRMYPREGQWRIFDVVIEGVSLTRNYRSQFKNYLTQRSMADLLALLEKKTAGVRPPKATS